MPRRDGRRGAFKVRARLSAIGIAMAGLVGLAPSCPADTHRQALGDALAGVARALIVSPAGLSGAGVETLKTAVAASRYVSIGEDHLSREIPMFAAALCDLMAPQGLAALVVEAGPVATATLAPALTSPDRLSRTAALDALYPDWIAFLDTSAESDLAAHCASVARPGFKVIGIDQEFIGSAGFLIDQILATRLSPDARRSVEALRQEERSKAAAAGSTGDPSGLLMLSISDTRLQAVEAALVRGGDPRARDLFRSLRVSHDIYAKNAAGSPDSNTVRALLMKRTFAAAAPATGKILVKLGDWHLYKGVNPLGERDMGNALAEMADVQGVNSLHVIVLGEKGVHAEFAGYGRPLAIRPFDLVQDDDYVWVKLASDHRAGAGGTIFDLRAIRRAKLDGVDAAWRRVLDGYDLLVLLPTLSPSDLIH